MLSGLGRQPLRVVTGERGRLVSWLRSGRSGAGLSFQLADILLEARKLAPGRCRQRLNCSGGTNTTSPRNAARPVTIGIAVNSQSSFGELHHRTGPSTSTFERSAAALDNPDHVSIVIHNYRWRLGLVPGDAACDHLEKRLSAGPTISVPTITLEGDANGAPHPDASTYAKKFTGKYAHRVVTGGIGRNLPQEARSPFAEAVIDAARDHQ